jgi:two-component system, NarL family, response regulator DevR
VASEAIGSCHQQMSALPPEESGLELCVTYSSGVAVVSPSHEEDPAKGVNLEPGLLRVIGQLTSWFPSPDPSRENHATSEAELPGGRPVATGPIGVFLVDDNEAVRASLRSVIDRQPDMSVVGESATVAGAIEGIVGSRPQVAILDLQLPDGNGIEIGRQIEDCCPEVNRILLTGAMVDEALVAATLAGAAGYLSKPASGASLLEVIREVTSGRQLIEDSMTINVMERLRHRSSLGLDRAEVSPLQHSVIELVANGKTNRQIGESLTIPVDHVQNHLSNFLVTAGITGRI